MKELRVICKTNLLNLNSVASCSTCSAPVRTRIFPGTGAALFVKFHKEPCWSVPPQSAMRPRDALRMKLKPTAGLTHGRARTDRIDAWLEQIFLLCVAP